MTFLDVGYGGQDDHQEEEQDYPYFGLVVTSIRAAEFLECRVASLETHSQQEHKDEAHRLDDGRQSDHDFIK